MIVETVASIVVGGLAATSVNSKAAAAARANASHRVTMWVEVVIELPSRDVARPAAPPHVA